MFMCHYSHLASRRGAETRKDRIIETNDPTPQPESLIASLHVRSNKTVFIWEKIKLSACKEFSLEIHLGIQRTNTKAF